MKQLQETPNIAQTHRTQILILIPKCDRLNAQDILFQTVKSKSEDDEGEQKGQMCPEIY